MKVQRDTEVRAPAAEPIEDLLRAVWKSARAFQMYLPNNPMYQRAEDSLRGAFVPVWETVDEFSLTINETDIVWEEDIVYQQTTKSESFAWMLYKDGMRQLTLRRGVERKEILTLLDLFSRARVLSADAGDDLLTLLWEHDFEYITYHFAEVIPDTGVLDPQALEMGLEPPGTAEEARELIRQDPAPPPKAPGIIDLDDFDSTLYFLEDQEVLALRTQVDEEYHRDVRGAALAAVLDVIEFIEDVAVRDEAIDVLQVLFPNLLVQGEFRVVAGLLREFEVVRSRVKNLPASAKARLEAMEAQLSEPAIVNQLVQAMDEVGPTLAEGGVAELIALLRPPALEPILSSMPLLSSVEVREILEQAAERLAASNTAELLRLLTAPDSKATLGLVGLCGRLKLQAAVPGLEQLLEADIPEVRAAAVDALGRIGSPRAIGALEPSLEDPDRTVRLAAVQVVGSKGYKGALARLERIVTEKTKLVLERSERLQFFAAYADVVGPAGLKRLEEMLHARGFLVRRRSAEIRTCAAYAIGRIRTPEARATLQRAEHDKELSVRNAVTRILREWPT